MWDVGRIGNERGEECMHVYMYWDDDVGLCFTLFFLFHLYLATLKMFSALYHPSVREV